jgi:hypothetical protein
MREGYKNIEQKSADVIHLWAVDLKAAGVRGSESAFTFRVVEADEDGDDVEKEYVVRVSRDADIPARFSNDVADPQIYRFFQSAQVMETLPPATDGNGETTTWTYTLLRTTEDEDVTEEQRANFVGLTLDASERLLSGEANPAGTETSTPHRSSAIGIYRAQDGDCNTATETETDENRRRIAIKDSDELDFQVHVYRHAAIVSFHYEAEGKIGESEPVDVTGPAYVYRPSASDEYTSRPYSYMASGGDAAIEEYQYDVDFPAGETSTEVMLVLNVHEDSNVSINGKRTEQEGQRHEGTILLEKGDSNPVEVRVRNGRVVGVHNLNLRLSGPSVGDIMVKAGDDDLLTGDQEYDKFDYDYEVETYHDMVTVETLPLDQYADAEVKVNGTLESQVEAIALSEGRNTITVTVDDAQTYTIVVVRADNVAPTFGSNAKSDIRVQVGKEVPASLGMLPMATGGNGDLEYMISGLPSGLSLGSSMDADGEMMYMIEGTPSAPGPYEQDFTVTWKAEDADADMVDDAAMTTFTITVTNAEIDYGDDSGNGDGTTATAGADALISIEISYEADGDTVAATLSPSFAFDTTDYMVDVPDDYSMVFVTAIRKNADASIRISNVVLTDDVNEHEFSSSTLAGMSNMITMTVVPPGDMASQDYTITVSTVSDSDASFTGADIEDITAVVGMMVSEELPAATSGNAPFEYSLVDHNGDGVGAGLMFDAATRMLSGTPMLDTGTTKAVYMMTYEVEDADGDMATIDFTLTVCVGDATGCTAGGGSTGTGNPGSTPMNVEVTRSGNSATLTWTPGDDATKQFVAAVILNPSTGTVLSTIRPSPAGADVAGDVGSYTFDNLLAGAGDYIYAVWGYDDDDMWKDASGNAYLGFATEQ